MPLSLANLDEATRGWHAPENVWPPRSAAFTYVELLVASAIGCMLLAVIVTIMLHAEQSFALITSYSELDAKSYRAISLLSEQIREATQVVEAKTNASGKSLTLTNAHDGVGTTFIWDSAARTLTLTRVGSTNLDVLLTGCDSWNCTLYDGAPVIKSGAISFTPSSSVSSCRLIELSWTCSRTVLGKAQASGVESVRFGLRHASQ